MREPDGLGAPLGELVGTTGKERRLRGTCSGDRHGGEICAAAQRPFRGRWAWLWCTSYGAFSWLTLTPSKHVAGQS